LQFALISVFAVPSPALDLVADGPGIA